MEGTSAPQKTVGTSMETGAKVQTRPPVSLGETTSKAPKHKGSSVDDFFVPPSNKAPKPPAGPQSLTFTDRQGVTHIQPVSSGKTEVPVASTKPSSKEPVTTKPQASSKGSAQEPSRVQPQPSTSGASEKTLRESSNGSFGRESPQNVATHEKHKANLAHQEAVNSVPVGSALKQDPHHFLAEWGVNSIKHGKHFTIRGVDGKFYNLSQVEGSLNGKRGIFEYIVNERGKLTHQRFIPDGVITGIPNKIPKK